MYQVKRGMVEWQVKDNFSVEVEAEVTFELIAPYLLKRLIQTKILRGWHLHYDLRNLVDLSLHERTWAIGLIRQQSWNWESEGGG